MNSGLIVALLLGAGLSAWYYNKVAANWRVVALVMAMSVAAWVLVARPVGGVDVGLIQLALR